MPSDGWPWVELLAAFAAIYVAFGVLATIITAIAVFAITGGARRCQHNRGRAG